MKPGLTAIVASHNEASLLRRCLPTVAFCDEVLVIDIASTDDTAAVGRANGARVVPHAWVPIAEHARADLIEEPQHDWLLLVDPDEEVPAALAVQIREFLEHVPEDVAVVGCPWQFRFRGEPLRGTVWGGVGAKGVVVHRRHVSLGTRVHSRTAPLPGFRAEAIAYDGTNAIAHYWAPTYRELVAKHARYLRLEGPDRFADGSVTGLKDIARTPFVAFRESYVRRAGYRDGVTGLALSLFWSVYSTLAKAALLRELRRRSASEAKT
jgi:glycosyltransferase involved in cell wall biosynthesis